MSGTSCRSRRHWSKRCQGPGCPSPTPPPTTFRKLLVHRGTLPVIPNNPTRKRHHPFDPALYRLRNLIERVFCRLEDWRWIATRHDKLVTNPAAAIALAIVVNRWL